MQRRRIHDAGGGLTVAAKARCVLIIMLFRFLSGVESYEAESPAVFFYFFFVRREGGVDGRLCVVGAGFEIARRGLLLDRCALANFFLNNCKFWGGTRIFIRKFGENFVCIDRNPKEGRHQSRLKMLDKKIWRGINKGNL